MGPRAPTEPAFTCRCHYCVHHIARLASEIETEGRYGRNTANDLRRLEGKVDTLEKKRARSEGAADERAKARDTPARALGLAGTGGTIYAIWELVSHFIGG